MTMEQLNRRQERHCVQFETAKQIRALLDEARKRYEALGGDKWEDDGIENDILELVSEEE